jgi:hypothetical protein
LIGGGLFGAKKEPSNPVGLFGKSRLDLKNEIEIL